MQRITLDSKNAHMKIIVIKFWFTDRTNKRKERCQCDKLSRSLTMKESVLNKNKKYLQNLKKYCYGKKN